MLYDPNFHSLPWMAWWTPVSGNSVPPMLNGMVGVLLANRWRNTTVVWGRKMEHRVPLEVIGLAWAKIDGAENVKNS